MSPELSHAMLTAAATVGGLMLSVWLLSLLLRDASIVDIAWGFGFVCVAWSVWFRTSGSSWVLPMLTTLWGLRLSVYLGWRNHGQPEDYRYQAMRRRWGSSFPLLSLIVVFGLQGLVMWVVSLPVQAGIALAAPPNSTWLAAGVLLWAVGLSFESIADWQLAAFRSNPDNAGTVLDTGLWHYTRHPNYFGDFLVWWGLCLIAIAHSAPWWTAIGPAVMSIFLMRVSGVTLLEQSLKKTKPQYAHYIATTNAFFPWFPREASAVR